MCFTRQSQRGGCIPFVSVGCVVSFHAKCMELRQNHVRNHIFERLIMKEVVEIRTVRFWQSVVMMNPFHDLFAEDTQLGDRTDRIWMGVSFRKATQPG